MENLQKQYNLSREAASRLLRVSIRTLDRYIRSKKLSTQVVEGRIWLDKAEVERFRYGKVAVARVDTSSVSSVRLSTDSRVDNVDNVHVINQGFDETVSSHSQESFTRRESSKNSAGTYKNLYNELKEELKEKQDRLEIANYRVGQLEAQVKSSIPMLEYHREKYENDKKAEELKNQVNESTNLIKRITLSLKYERFSKRIFLIILLILLALQPLWLIFN